MKKDLQILLKWEHNVLMPSPALPPRIEIKGDSLSVVGTLGRGSAKVPSTKSGPASGILSNVLTAFCTVLMVGLLVLLWKWDKAEERAQVARRQADIAAKFGDGVLQDLALAREQSAKLDRERANLVRMLGEAERLHATLRGELSQWQQKQDATVAAAQVALAEADEQNQALGNDLGNAQAKLSNSTQTLEQERMAAQQELNRADAELQRAMYQSNLLAQQRNAAEAQKAKAERSTQELDKKAQALDAENTRMDADISRLKGVINNEEILRNELNLRNVALAAQANQLRATVGRLEAKIRSMEQERERDKPQKRGN